MRSRAWLVAALVAYGLVLLVLWNMNGCSTASPC